MNNIASQLRQIMEQLDQLSEFAPDSTGGGQSYYTSTENFINNFRQQKAEEIEELTRDDWEPEEVEDLKQSVGNDIYRFEQVKNNFTRGLKSGFDAYLQMDTQLKDSLGCYWISDNLDLNADWTKVYGRPWGNENAC